MPNVTIALDGLHADARGEIANLPSFTTHGVTVVSSTAGAVRGNHYHLNESHLQYVVSGHMIYIEEDEAGGTQVFEVKAGESVVTPPRMAHCVVFPVPTVIVTLSDWDRRGRHYEDELVRIAPMEQRAEVTPFLGGIPGLVTRPAGDEETGR